MSISSACRRSSVHLNGVPFFMSSIIGLAIAAKPGIKGLWYPKTPMVFRTCLTLVSVLGHSEIPVTFEGSIHSPLPVTNHPKSVICGRMILHFDAFRKYDFSSQFERNAYMASSCSALLSASSVVAIHQSSMYWPAFSLYCSRNGAKSFRMVLWKKAGALHIPKYMTSRMYVPWRVWIAALCRSSSARRILLYPWRMSNLENNVLPCSLFIASRMFGIGLWSRTVQAFTLL